MNIWNEPYPICFDELRKLGDNISQNLENRLKDPACTKLHQLYEIQGNSKVYRKLDAFDTLQYLPNTKLTQKSLKDDELSGIYVFGESSSDFISVKPVYVGISRTIFRRLKQHGWGTTHNHATFAILKHKYKNNFTGSRALITPKDISRQQQIIKNYKVAIYLEKDPYIMYFMEVYLAGKWKTPWNSFRTH